jgi:phenylpyruvate tautomerase PptA (4-oxalocrotonate tautomerase family)
MPLLRIDLYKGRTDTELQALLDAVHRAMLAAFKVPERDRYQIVNERDPTRMIMEDTGLDIPRTDKFVFIQVTTRPRTREEKQTFYRLTIEELERNCAIAPSDVMINCVTCEDEDWTFGYGRAQFLTGEL